MASALARTSHVIATEAGPILVLDVAYSGNAQTEVGGGGYNADVQVPLLPDDQPAAIRSKMSAAISADALARGFTVVGANMTLPTFQKG